MFRGDAADGYRGHLPPAEHLQTEFRTQGVPISAQGPSDRQGEPGVGDGHHLHPDGPWSYLVASDWYSRYCSRGGCPTPWKPITIGESRVVLGDEQLEAFTSVLLNHGVQLHGPEQLMDNVFVDIAKRVPKGVRECSWGQSHGKDRGQWASPGPRLGGPKVFEDRMQRREMSSIA